jgi:DUF971 family protein
MPFLELLPARASCTVFNVQEAEEGRSNLRTFQIPSKGRWAYKIILRDGNKTLRFSWNDLHTLMHSCQLTNIYELCKEAGKG